MISEVVLLILFNHKYEPNIEKLRKIYSGRFKNIYFIMPFYRGLDKDVIGVYGHSFYFQGYIAQALQKLKNEKYDHYIIIGDDLVLNPCINENNYTNEFGLTPTSGFIPEIFMLANITKKPRLLQSNSFPKWYWNYSALSFNFKKQLGIEVEKEIPSAESAFNIISKHGYTFESVLNLDQVVDPVPSFKNILKNFNTLTYWFKEYLKYFSKIKRTIKYPLVGSYSDIVIIPATSIDSFAHISGVFSSLSLFAEIAIPTALLLTTKNVVQEKDLQKKGTTLWPDQKEFYTIKDKYNGSLENLFIDFPKETLYIHPIKLSQWK